MNSSEKSSGVPLDRSEEQNNSHAEALKSTSIIGGSTAIVMLIRMVRTKVLAVLLGPAGVGLEAMFDSVLSLARMAVDLGISNSGVRQIAAAVSSGDQQVIATTVITLRRVCLLLGILGGVALFFARESISRIAFGTPDHASDFGWLAIIPILCGIAGGQGALLQGMRRIGDLAKMRILGALATALSSIPIIWLCGQKGIPAYLILTAVVSLMASWFYARRIRMDPVGVKFGQTIREANQLLRLGLVFAASGLMTTGAFFLLRVLVTRQEGVDGAGQFQAANALSMVYVGFVLQAMGTDFYPRLTAVAEDDKRCNQLVNEQAEISTLLTLPGVLATIAFSPWVIHVFYSRKFDLAAEILCWQVTGMLLRVNAWPMGFIMLAKGRGAVIFWAELAVYSVYAGLGWLGLKMFGLPGVGMAFLGHYVFHCVLTYSIVRRMSGFRWSSGNVRLWSIGALTASVTLCARLVLADPWATIIGCSLAVITGLYCVKTLVRLIGAPTLAHWLQKLRMSLPFRKSGSGVAPVTSMLAE
ncbi:O-antigen translocase [Verrucomicrobiota bacterium sgz303538]